MNEIDKAREAATVQCEHEWLRSYLIPRCHKCGHTEATILYLNQGIRQGFDAGYATATAKIERLEKAVKLALKAIDHADNGHCAVMPEGLKTTVCHEYRKFNLDGTLEKCRDPECLSNVLKEALEKENTDA